MNSFYQQPRQYSADDLQRIADMNNHNDNVMGMMGSNGMDTSGMVGSPSLDELLQQNEKDLERRRRSFNTPQSYGSSRSPHSDDPRRASMMEFGPGSHSDLEGFQFDPNPVPSNTAMQRPGNIAQRRLNSQRARRQMSNDSLNLNTDYSSMPSYNSLNTSSPYGQSINSADPSSGIDMSNEYMTNSMLMSIDFNTPNNFDGTANGNVTPRNTFMQNNFTSPMASNQMQQSMATPLSTRTHDPGGGAAQINIAGQNVVDNTQGMQSADPMANVQTQLPAVPMSSPKPGMPVNQNNAVIMPNARGLPTYNPASRLQASANLDVSTDATGTPFQGKNNASQQVVPQYRNAYSSTGFDMLRVLTQVATRPKPQISIGAVDLSCAFVVCDVTQHDLPIVYCSDIFERLTASTKHEILGRNCRFLQAPDGKIQAGVKRKYVDDLSVLRIKNMISQRQEIQISLINYRKGGQPFMNLLTMIPISWDTDELKYYVGFQVDLVEQPTSITNKNPGMKSAIELFGSC